MFDTIAKVSISTDSAGRLVAVVTGDDVMGRPCRAEYRTDPRAEGLWEWDASRRDWRQVRGTTQFYARNARDMRYRIRKMLRF